jgi:hypothetical protein
MIVENHAKDNGCDNNHDGGSCMHRCRRVDDRKHVVQVDLSNKQ